MLELLVLGKIPGTTIQIDIVVILFAFSVLIALTTGYFLLSRIVRRAITAYNELITIELISL
jgi:hypothetical protein